MKKKGRELIFVTSWNNNIFIGLSKSRKKESNFTELKRFT